jgi:hypothetical protein
VYGVRVRRKGHPLLTATFERLTDVHRWAQRMEAAMSGDSQHHHNGG